MTSFSPGKRRNNEGAIHEVRFLLDDLYDVLQLLTRLDLRNDGILCCPCRTCLPSCCFAVTIEGIGGAVADAGDITRQALSERVSSWQSTGGSAGCRRPLLGACVLEALHLQRPTS